MASAGNILIIVENLPVPLDRRVWQEANLLKEQGYEISIICPKMRGYEQCFEIINGIYIYRHPLPIEGKGLGGFFLEYPIVFFWEFIFTWKVLFKRGFDVIHACNPPDFIFLIGLFFKLFFHKKFVFDHHDINPELYLAKRGKKDFFYWLLLLLEKGTFMTADISIATNESYKNIALSRGKMAAENVFIVRSGPIIENLSSVPPKPALKKGKQYMVGYVGVMAKQDGVDYLLRAIDYIVHKKNRSDIYFGLIGKGPDWESLSKYASDLKIDSFVNFTGRLPDKEMIEHLSTCEVCVNPDEVNEFNDKSTMNKILEYMTLGKPIVQFDMTEGRYSAEESSLYARPNDVEDFGDKILELLDDERRRQKMGAYGKSRMQEKLSWNHTGRELLRAYSMLLAKSR